MSRLVGSALVAISCTMAGGYLWQAKTPHPTTLDPRAYKSLSTDTFGGKLDWLDADKKTLIIKTEKNSLLPPLTLGEGVKFYGTDDKPLSLYKGLEGNEVRVTIQDKGGKGEEISIHLIPKKE